MGFVTQCRCSRIIPLYGKPMEVKCKGDSPPLECKPPSHPMGTAPKQEAEYQGCHQSQSPGNSKFLLGTHWYWHWCWWYQDVFFDFAPSGVPIVRLRV